MIKVILADDHVVVRKGLATLIESEMDIEVIGEVSDGKEAIELTREAKPDVVIMDISMPNLNGLEATRRIKSEMPEVRVLALTVHSDDEYIFRILRAGASGYLLKKTAPDELISAIRTLHGGGAYLGSSISESVVQAFRERPSPWEAESKYDELTDREREILQLIAEGNTTKDIAEKLYISTNTVSTHRKNLMEKLGIHSIAGLTQYAIQKGLVEVEATEE